MYKRQVEFPLYVEGTAINSEKDNLDERGYIGIGTENPRAKLEITDGDIYLSDISQGVIMKSPNGSCWHGTLDDTGQLSFVGVTCP